MRRIAFAMLMLAGLSASAATVTVNVGPGLSFNPPNVTVNQGDTVQWVWAAGAGPHTTTSNSAVSAENWNSGILVDPATFNHTFTTLGTWPYYCAVHSLPGGNAMNGTVQVNAPPPVVPAMSRYALIALAAALASVAFFVLRR